MVDVSAAPGAGEFLGVDWSSIALVSITSLVATVVIVSFFSLGLRLLALGFPDDVQGSTNVVVAAPQRPLVATVGGILCIGVGIAGVLYGIYLVIPLFHP